jgi:hypothetical protein
MTLEAVEFARRFLVYVLPAGFVRVRHYGRLDSRCRREKLVRCRELLGMTVTPVDLAPARPEPITPPVHEAAATLWLRDRVEREPEDAGGFASNGGVLPMETGRGDAAASHEGGEPAGQRAVGRGAVA